MQSHFKLHFLMMFLLVAFSFSISSQSITFQNNVIVLETSNSVRHLISFDHDNDGVADSVDIDDDNDGILDTVEGVGDADADDIQNKFDLDSDADGIPDNIEAQGTFLFNSPSGSDSDWDGLDISYDNSASFGGSGILPFDTDGDLIPDYLDTDSDNDGKPDSVEGWDVNGNFSIDLIEQHAILYDVDSDGINDGYDFNTTLAVPTNSTNPTFYPDIINAGGDRDWREKNVLIGVAKFVSAVELNVDNTYNVSYKIVVSNLSIDNLSSINISDNLAITFPSPSAYMVNASPVLLSAGSGLQINPSFDGIAQLNLTLPSTSTIAIGFTDTILFTVKILPNGFFGPFANTAIATGSNGVTVNSDSSVSSNNPDPDNSGRPTEMSPVFISLMPHTTIGCANNASNPEVQDNGSYLINYSVIIKNFGNDTLHSIFAFDSLQKTFSFPIEFLIAQFPHTIDSVLIGNSSFDGINDVNLVMPSGKLFPQQSEVIYFSVAVFPFGVTSVSNIVNANATGQFGVEVSDVSTNGFNPDVNGNGNPSDVNESEVTITNLPELEIIIPHGFSPNNDGINDIVFIKYIENFPENNIVIFNQWGNVVFKGDGYDNKTIVWDGHNSGLPSVGGGDLPEGTYFYIAQFTNYSKEIKNRTGYIYLKR